MTTLVTPNPEIQDSTVVEAADGSVLRVTPTRRGERLIRVSLPEVSPHLVDAILAAEDGRFFRHAGVDQDSQALASKPTS